MKKVKITILKTMLNEDLSKEYGIPGLKACPMMKVSDGFYADYAWMMTMRTMKMDLMTATTNKTVQYGKC